MTDKNQTSNNNPPDDDPTYGGSQELLKMFRFREIFGRFPNSWEMKRIDRILAQHEEKGEA